MTRPWVILATYRLGLKSPIRVVSRRVKAYDPEEERWGHRVALSSNRERAIRFATADDARHWLATSIDHHRPEWLLTVDRMPEPPRPSDAVSTPSRQGTLWSEG